MRLFALPNLEDLGYLDGHNRSSPVTAVVLNGPALIAANLGGELNYFQPPP